MLPMLLLLGCVSKGDYELIQVQLDATRTALSAKNADCYEQTQSCEASLDHLGYELQDTRGRLDGLDERYQQLLGEVELTRMSLATLVTTCEEPPEDPCPRGRRPPPEPEEPDPLVKATIEDVHQALALRSRHLYEEEQRRQAHDQLSARFATLEAEERLTLLQDGERSVVRIPSVQIFNEGRVSISPRGEALMIRLATALEEVGDRSVQIAAHTDDLPHHTAEHNSVWELGFDQALTVLRALEREGVQLEFGAASFAGERPIASNETPEGRKANSRIEFVFGEPVESPEPVEHPPVEAMPEAGGGFG